MEIHTRSKLIGAVMVLWLAATVYAKDIVVGQATALTGALASSGTAMQLGAKIHFDAVNAGGGINGVRISFVSKDDQYKVSETVRLVKELVEKDDAVVLVGGSGTANNEALLNQGTLMEKQIAMVGPRTGGASLREPFNPYMFHIRPSYAKEINKAIEYLVTVGMKKIGVVYQDDIFGKEGLLVAKDALAKANLEPDFLSTYERNSTNVDVPVKVALASKPQAVLLLTTTASTGAFVKMYRESKGGAGLIALSINDPLEITKTAGLAKARGLMITTVFPSPHRVDYRVVKEYQVALKKFAPANTQPSFGSLEGYIAARVIVDALRKSGSNPSRERVLQSLETSGDRDIGGFYVNFGPTVRSGSSYVDINIISEVGTMVR